MPTYTYACTDCDEQLEVVQSFTADPLTECPRCQGRLRKVFHPVGVVFKGSGFYRTDSRDTKKKTSGATASDKGSTSGGSDKSSSGSTSKDGGSGGSSSGGSSGEGSAGSPSSGSAAGSPASSGSSTTSG